MSPKVDPFLAAGNQPTSAMTAALEFLRRGIFGSILRNHLYSYWKFTTYSSVPVCEQVRTGGANAARAFLKSNILRRCGGGAGAGKGNRFYYSTFIYIAPFIQSSLSILKFISISWIKYKYRT